MDQFLLKLSLLLFLSITLPLVCTAQDIDADNYKWLQGEWRNNNYGDILDIGPDSLQFLKNGLIFKSEDISLESINDVIGGILYQEKEPYQLGFYYDTILDESYLALLFNHQTESYPYEMGQIGIGIDAANHILYYFNQYGERVCLDKFSDLTFKQQLDKKLKEKQEQLSTEIASNQFNWLHGQWKEDDTFNCVLNIDGDSIKLEERKYTESSFEVAYTEKQPINLQYIVNDFTHEVELVLMLMPWEIYVDKKNKRVYSYYDFDQLIVFEKISEYTEEEQVAITQKEEKERQVAYRKSQLLKYLVWAVKGIVGIVLILLLVKLMKRLIPKIKASAIKASKKTKEKAKIVSTRAKESKDKFIDKSKELMEKYRTVGEQSYEKIKTTVKNNENNASIEKDYTPWLVLLLGIYLIVFFDIYIGLLLLIPAIIYLILRKVKPEKAERMVTDIKGKLQPISSKPLLKHGLIALLIGIVVLRTLGEIPGWIIIGLTVVFLALSRFAPEVALKIDNGFTKTCNKLKFRTIWKNNWVKVAVFALLLLVPILGIRPGQSVYGIAQSDNEMSSSSSKRGKNQGSNHVHDPSCVSVRFVSASFGGQHVMVKNVCSQKKKIEKVTIEVYIQGEIPPYEKREKELKEYNLKPGKEERAGFLQMSDYNWAIIRNITLK